MPYSDPLVIKLRIVNAIVSRVLVDRGSSTDITFWEVFKQIGVDQNLIIPGTSLVATFNEALVYPMGTVTLPVHTVDRVIHVEFQIIDIPSSMNVIMG